MWSNSCSSAYSTFKVVVAVQIVTYVTLSDIGKDSFQKICWNELPQLCERRVEQHVVEYCRNIGFSDSLAFLFIYMYNYTYLVISTVTNTPVVAHNVCSMRTCNWIIEENEVIYIENVSRQIQTSYENVFLIYVFCCTYYLDMRINVVIAVYSTCMYVAYQSMLTWTKYCNVN